MKPTPRRLLRALASLSFILAIPMLWLVSCQSRLIYFPRAYPSGTVDQWTKSTSGKPIAFTTSQGTQQAYLQGNLHSPRNLWIVCGGNGTVALDWSDWLSVHAPLQDAYLLVDLPGYGRCEGNPNPQRILENFRTVLPLAAKEVGLTTKPDPSRLRFFGHSLGAASVLSAAAELNISRGVVLAPFTSTMDMAKAMIGLPVGFLVTHRFDNAARIDEIISQSDKDTSILILHGTDDEVIPISMSRTLAANRAPFVTLTEISHGHHNDISDLFPQFLSDALHEIGARTATR